MLYHCHVSVHLSVPKIVSVLLLNYIQRYKIVDDGKWLTCMTCSCTPWFQSYGLTPESCELCQVIFSEPGRMSGELMSQPWCRRPRWRWWRGQKTLTMAITSLLEVIGLLYCTCVFLVTRPFTWYCNV